MLSPSSPAQKSLCEEDGSSGSDAGSEAGLEPETDRFGFIVTNGSTAGSVGPPPELVRQREAKWINIMLQWDRILLKKTSKVKVQCQKGIPASLKAKCWPLLCGASDRMKQNENLYKSLDEQPALQSWVDVIERDLDRQFPFHEMFLSKDGHGQRGLFRVLKAYTQYQPEEGYCQAQGPVAAVLLMNMPAEEAFWCLVQISEQYLPGYYSPLLEGVLFDAAMLTWVLKRTCNAAYKHLQHHGVEPLMFATDWLMCLFTRHLPFNTLLRVWDLFFCYGVRVLLQVAVVLVRRVLGRADQRKRCQGQMETLERLRGVREHVQDDEDAFIAEVCSVPLSAKDLEKQTEKELEKWRKDRPSSTFDPRGRCLGYRMAWARARRHEEERDRKEREKGNLSVPIARSASTLSLSPSMLRNKWKKGGKANAGEWEGSGGGSKVVRHLSMGAKEDFRSWADTNFKKVQGVQEEEDIFFEEQQKESETKSTGQTEQKESKKMDDIQKTPTEQVEETVTVTEQIEQAESSVTEDKGGELKETEESKETNVEAEQTTSQAQDQTLENIPRQGEELDSCKHSQNLEQQSQEDTDQETEVKDENKEPEHEAESDHMAAMDKNQMEMQKDADANAEVETEGSVDPSEEQMIETESTETETVQQVDTVTEVSATTETSPGSDTGGESEAPTVKDPSETETGTHQQQQEMITETDNSSQRDAFDGKYHSTESLAETDMKEEPHTQTETETEELAQTPEKVEEGQAAHSEAERVELESEQHRDSLKEAETLIQCSPECTQPEGDLEADAETAAETPISNDTEMEAGEAPAQYSEEECEAEASEPSQEKETHSDVENDQTQAEETPTETTDSMALPQKEASSAETEEVNLTAEPDGSSGEVSTTEETPPEKPKVQAAEGAVEEEVRTENVQQNTEMEDDVFISTEARDSNNTDRNPQLQEKEAPPVKDQTELGDSSLTQASQGSRSSRSSGDVCIRKSSSSRGSKLGRRLSEDLFIMPEKTSQSESIPDQPQVKLTEVNPTQTPLSLSEEGTEVQQEPPKRFGLFRRLRGGEQPKKAKAKGKMQVPKILIQDFSDVTGTVEEEAEEKLTSRERRRRRRERERREKEEERLRKKREKELEKERRKPQTRGKSFQVQKEKGSSDEPHPAKSGTKTLRYSASFSESYF
ncbi:trichohyalin [Acanthopagrus latus]|uniref:trichohyalin n=1 Tax=Acanthopagrus latus TaxID=8177 RepID=UPI00187C42BE|nr:trichohyalin [Acanthopagrus latus]